MFNDYDKINSFAINLSTDYPDLNSAVIFLFKKLSCDLEKRYIYAKEFYECREWLTQLCIEYRAKNKPYIAYINGILIDKFGVIFEN